LCSQTNLYRLSSKSFRPPFIRRIWNANILITSAPDFYQAPTPGCAHHLPTRLAKTLVFFFWEPLRVGALNKLIGKVNDALWVSKRQSCQLHQVDAQQRGGKKARGV
jgi:hypothetical protein